MKGRSRRWLGIALAASVIALSGVGFVATLTQAASAPRAPVPRIINGTVVGATHAANRWPFIVGLVLPDDPTWVYCGGSHIAPTLILTAAHCVTYGHKRVDRMDLPEAGKVVLGRTDLTDETTGQVISISEIYVHPDWNISTLANDMAILRLAEAPSPPVPTAPIARDPGLWGSGAGVKQGANGPFAAGWGSTSSWPTHYPMRLRETRLSVPSDRHCTWAKEPVSGRPIFVCEMQGARTIYPATAIAAGR